MSCLTTSPASLLRSLHPLRPHPAESSLPSALLQLLHSHTLRNRDCAWNALILAGPWILRPGRALPVRRLAVATWGAQEVEPVGIPPPGSEEVRRPKNAPSDWLSVMSYEQFGAGQRSSQLVASRSHAPWGVPGPGPDLFLGPGTPASSARSAAFRCHCHL